MRIAAPDEQADPDGDLPDREDRARRWPPAPARPSAARSSDPASASAGLAPGNSLSAPNQKNTIAERDPQEQQAVLGHPAVIRRSVRSNRFSMMRVHRVELLCTRSVVARRRRGDGAAASGRPTRSRACDARRTRRGPRAIGGSSGGRHGLGKQPLPDDVRAFGGGARAVGLPGLEVAPVRHQRPVERGLVALERVGRAEEVAAGPDLGDRVEAEAGLVDRRAAGAPPRASGGSRRR